MKKEKTIDGNGGYTWHAAIWCEMTIRANRNILNFDPYFGEGLTAFMGMDGKASLRRLDSEPGNMGL